MSEPKQRYDDDGDLERRCSKCGEWWPASREFFYSCGRKGLHSWCKACVQENDRTNPGRVEQKRVASENYARRKKAVAA